jgi:murein endopeptidase
MSTVVRLNQKQTWGRSDATKCILKLERSTLRTQPNRLLVQDISTFPSSDWIGVHSCKSINVLAMPKEQRYLSLLPRCSQSRLKLLML